MDDRIADDMSHAYQDGYNDGYTQAIKDIKLAHRKTNGDRIRNMPDEELARFIGNVDYDPWQRCDQCKFESCEECCLEWLKQEAEDD